GGSISVVPNSSERSYVLIELKNGSNTSSTLALDMGKIVYHLGDRELGYEGGGVWSKYISGSVMVSPPEVHYNGMTLTLPVVNVSGKSAYGGKGKVSISVQRNSDIKIIYPTKDLTNPISSDVDRIVITIYSSYYDAWEDFFKSMTFAQVSSNDSEKKVTLTLETPPVFTNFSYGALASNSITLGNHAEFDCYNSSLGSYASTKSDNGSIRANNKLELTGPQTKVNGSAMSGNTIMGQGKATKYVYGTPPYGGVTAGLGFKPAVEKLSIGNTANLVYRKTAEYMALNNNSNNLCITAGTILNGSEPDPCTIFSGNYYLTKFDLQNNYNLTFDTTNNPINIAVPGNINLKKTIVNVKGTNPVTIYLMGGMDINTNSYVNYNNNPNQTSSLFQVISSSSSPISFTQGGTNFVGFVYAPFATINVNQGSEVWGAMVGQTFVVEQHQKVHFDEALNNLDMGFVEGVIIMYLHITQNDISANIE
ncbi:MAG: hypothetical protein KKG76_06035, partial [Euryarchaeota archaeon]|nr:hypothetical protein [Euryarchaeota archaeon]